MTLRRLALISIAAPTLLGFTASLLAKKPKPQPCPDGRFLVTTGTLIGGPMEAIIIGDSRLSISSGCPAVPARPKAHKTFTGLTARWRGCGNVLAGKVMLQARIEAPDCNVIKGLFKAKKPPLNVRFEARRSVCGDGIFDPGREGEQCDAGEGCPADRQCTASCTCEPRVIAAGTGTTTTTPPTVTTIITGTTTTTTTRSLTTTTATTTTTSTSSPTTTTATTTSTSTTLAAVCGNGVKEAGEACDPPCGPGCPDGQVCTNACSCETTTACACGTPDPPTMLQFTSTITRIAGGTCGIMRDDAGSVLPDVCAGGSFAGQPCRTASDCPGGICSQGRLACGGLYFGGAGVSVPLPAVAPDMGTAFSKVTACTNNCTLTLGATSASDTGSNRTCTSAGCLFGPPVPVTNPPQAQLSTCLVNRVARDAAGTADCSTGETPGLSVPLNSDIYLTGNLLAFRCRGGARTGEPCGGVADTTCAPGTCEDDSILRCSGGANGGNTCQQDSECPGGRCAVPIRPCPICNPETGKCNGGPNNGLSCKPGDSASLGDAYPTTHDCPPPPEKLLGTLPISVQLTTGTASRTAVDNLPAQTNMFCGFCRHPNTLAFARGRCSGGTNANDPCAFASHCPGGTCVTTQGVKCSRCTGGLNDDGACASDADCPGGTCTAAGNSACRETCSGGTNPGAPCEVPNCGPPGPPGTGGTCSAGGTCTNGPTPGALCCAGGGVCLGGFTSCQQHTAGAFGQLARTVEVTGKGAGPVSDRRKHDATLATVFCIPPTFDNAVDASSDLPGPAALSFPASMQLLPTTAPITTTTTATTSTTTTTIQSTPTTSTTTTTTLPGFCGVVDPPLPPTCPLNSSGACPGNPSGGPDELDFTVANLGTDLDFGWTGTSHNFPVVGGSQLKLCLIDCDPSTNPVCGICGPTGRGSINTAMLAPPLPLLAANVPLCLSNRFVPGEVITGTADLSTGDVDVTVDLLSDVFLTTAGEVCPRCRNGSCTSGANAGNPCAVEGSVVVAQAAGDKSYPVSRDCPPSRETSQFAGTQTVHLPLTSGRALCNGPRPCQARPGDPSVGVPVQDDQCGGGSCNASCTGLACIGTTSDGRCRDSKGGISQLCCSTDTTRPCFPTAQRAGVAGLIERTGLPTPPMPRWPDPTYPKTGVSTLVSTFCEPATTSNTVNTTSGLPGPGALIVPGTVVVKKFGTCEPIVRDGQGTPGTYQLASVQGPKICQTNALQNRFRPCSTDTDCGGTNGSCVPTPFVTADGVVLPFPNGINTVLTVAAEGPPATCDHTACIACGNGGAPCAGIPGCSAESGCIRSTCCDAPGFTAPTFLVPLLGGLCSRFDQYRCGFGVVNTSNPQVGDNEVTKMADTSDPGPDCRYGTADDPPVKPCNTSGSGAGNDLKGKVTRTIGDGMSDTPGIHYRAAIPLLWTTWLDDQSPQGTCIQGSTFDSGELLVTQVVLNAEFSTAGATGGFIDMNSDGCARVGAGFTNFNKDGPWTLVSPPAAPQPYDGHTDSFGAASTAVSAGVALTGGGPLFDLGFIAVLTNGPFTRLPTQSCSCNAVDGCPE